MSDPIRPETATPRPGHRAVGRDEGDAAATAFRLRSRLALVVASLTDALADAASPLAPPQRARVEAAHRAALAIVTALEATLGEPSEEPGSGAPRGAGSAELPGALSAILRNAAAASGAALRVEKAAETDGVADASPEWERVILGMVGVIARAGGGTEVSAAFRGHGDGTTLEVRGLPGRAQEEAAALLAAIGALASVTVGTATGEGGEGALTVRLGGRPAALGDGAMPPSPAAPRAEGIGPARVLLIADDVELRACLGGMLAPRWRVEPAAGASAAVAAARAETPDLVLIDADAVAWDALAISAELRADTRSKRVPIVMLGGRAAGARSGEGAGPDEFVAKPFSSRDLVARVASHLELSRVEEATRREHRARLEAEAANRAKDEFIAMISHELRTPLGAILIWAQLLRTEELDAAATTRAVGMIERSTKTMAQLIDDLLDVSRIIAGKLTFETRPVDLRSVVEAALDGALPAAKSKAVLVEKAISPVPPVTGDAGRLQQVVGNLLANAIKFTPEAGRVEVSLDRVASHARIRVRDTGMGINPEFLPFIFERFRQADSTSTRKQKGLGLGLAIARHLVELHGGTIEAASQGEGQGSTFTVRLPLAVRDTLPDLEDEPSAAEPTLSGITVLVVDDEEDAREAMAVLLGQAGARVKSVASAREALAAIQRERPDLLLSDIAMPGEDGYGLIRRVRALEAGTGVRLAAAALTAYATLDDRRKALQAGYDEHISKPVDPARLISSVAMLVESRRPSV